MRCCPRSDASKKGIAFTSSGDDLVATKLLHFCRNSAYQLDMVLQEGPKVHDCVITEGDDVTDATLEGL